MTGKDQIAQLQKLADLTREMQLVATILHYARSGNATELMVRQAIELLEENLLEEQYIDDQGLIKEVRKLKEELDQALALGLRTLRSAKPPTQEKRLIEDPLVAARRAEGHQVRRQHRCSGGIIDIYDLTTDEIIECKVSGGSKALGEAAGQLQRYKKSFPGSSLVIAVYRLEDEAGWLAQILRREGITIIEIEGGDFS